MTKKPTDTRVEPADDSKCEMQAAVDQQIKAINLAHEKDDRALEEHERVDDERVMEAAERLMRE